MKGPERVLAIDASTPRMQRWLPEMPVEAINRMRLLRAANQSLTTYIDRILRPIGFSESTLHSLFLLFASDDGAATPGALCELVGLTKANMTRVLDKLAKKNFVSRQADASDGRRQVIRITEEGRRFVQSVLPAISGPMTMAMADLSPRELSTLDKLLRQLVLSMDSGERLLRAAV